MRVQREHPIDVLLFALAFGVLVLTAISQAMR